jgi:N-acetylmuramoyl-L-alanine amidase
VHGQSSDANLYKEALTREAALRDELSALRPADAAAPLVQRIRVMVGAYEDIARLFPDSEYGDNALWQGGVLAADLFVRFGDVEDRDAAQRLLQALVTRFPSSTLTAKVPAHLTRLGRPVAPPQPVPAAPAATASSRGPAASPAPAAHSPSPASGPVTLRAIRREVLPEVVRITLDLDREVVFSDERLTDPPRAFVDLLNTRPAEALKDATIPIDDRLVKHVRVGRQIDTRTRIAFDLIAPARYSVYAMYNPYRVVVDFEKPAAGVSPPPRATRSAGTAPATAAASPPAAIPASRIERPAPPSPPSANAGGGFSLSRQLGLGVARIVIDPGHGGHDPGTEGRGLTESGLVLDVALRLEKLLQAQKNVEVMLTRRTNTFVSLEERTAIANRSEADLFLSIHANSSAAAGVRGVETYFLNFAPNPEAEAIAARENAGSSRSMRELPDLVEAITLNNKIDESRDLARIVQATLFERLRKVNRNLKNLGVKQAPFMVLIGAGMPAILAEISFMSNSAEAALLKTDRYRQQIAEALLAGINRYRQALQKSPAVAASQ